MPCIVGPYLHGMARPQVADRGVGLQIWREAANILNKQSRTSDKGWSSSLRLGEGLTTHHRKKQLVTNPYNKPRNGTDSLARPELYSPPDIIRNIKSRRLRWAGHVAHMGESRNAYRVMMEDEQELEREIKSINYDQLTSSSQWQTVDLLRKSVAGENLELLLEVEVTESVCASMAAVEEAPVATLVGDSNKANDSVEVTIEPLKSETTLSSYSQTCSRKQKSCSPEVPRPVSSPLIRRARQLDEKARWKPELAKKLRQSSAPGCAAEHTGTASENPTFIDIYDVVQMAATIRGTQELELKLRRFCPTPGTRRRRKMRSLRTDTERQKIEIRKETEKIREMKVRLSHLEQQAQRNAGNVSQSNNVDVKVKSIPAGKMEGEVQYIDLPTKEEPNLKELVSQQHREVMCGIKTLEAHINRMQQKLFCAKVPQEKKTGSKDVISKKGLTYYLQLQFPNLIKLSTLKCKETKGRSDSTKQTLKNVEIKDLFNRSSHIPKSVKHELNFENSKHVKHHQNFQASKTHEQKLDSQAPDHDLENSEPVQSVCQNMFRSMELNSDIISSDSVKFRKISNSSKSTELDFAKYVNLVKSNVVVKPEISVKINEGKPTRLVQNVRTKSHTPDEHNGTPQLSKQTSYDDETE
ncbi:hypothetical protein ANN_20758 [Periplaneta americana]|uniref:Uncharacterized protein n=1 Tax=Periplaneta americana TaxID=6978 RepID=A0ABQ8SES6_PERAM|nr:hypothetical protein ANN_20758 [Periplaneta americana]